MEAKLYFRTIIAYFDLFLLQLEAFGFCSNPVFASGQVSQLDSTLSVSLSKNRRTGSRHDRYTRTANGCPVKTLHIYEQDPRRSRLHGGEQEGAR
jgi:hypothetical protein